MKMKKKSS